MTISSLTKKLAIVAVATLVTVAAGSAEAAYGENGLAPSRDMAAARSGAAIVPGDLATRDVVGVSNPVAARDPLASGSARWSAAGIDPGRALGASRATK